ncbi:MULTISPECIES: sodium:solute symporter family protein [Oceanobacillus]|uniref:Sodium:solute symporter n=1 Tax=Oceanobacillus aidingensis TaxID=645964 RepID=A0ABV9JXQ6_9BACI|nr:sodium:solute symporter family protein [Oceanobacillus oncorhynchi]MDM8100702.1 sodium:solute symporter family protein [Oceanobacillus oncorhynchi]UUI41440.1 sodium:solute symporter family protein [Oceanobacillus oncorhynchi]
MSNLAFSGTSGIIIMLFYGFLMLFIGFITYWRNRGLHQSNKEFYLGGGNLSVFVLFFTFFATQYSGNTVVGYAPTAYRMGFMWMQSITFFILIVVGYLMFAPRLYALSKKHQFITPSDYIDKRFKSKAVTLLASLLMLYGLCNYLLEQIIAIGHGVSGLTGGTIPYQAAVVFFVTVMIIYGWLGGMRSVAYTDTMQGIALLFGVAVLLIGSMIYFGGLPSATEYAATISPEKLGVPDSNGLVSWFSMLILVMIGAAIYPHAIQRIFAAKSEKSLKKSLSWMAWMPFVTSGFVFIIGIIGIQAFPGLSEGDSEQLVGMMANHIAMQNPFFYWAMVLLFGGIVAAIISTADSVLLTLSSVISKDIYARYINKSASDKKQILVGKLTGVALVIILLLIAWYPPATLYRIFILKFELLIQIAPAFLLGLYWKQLHRHALFIGMLAGTIIASVMAFTGQQPLGIASGLWGLAVNFMLCVGLSFFLKVPKSEVELLQKEIS